MKLLLKAVVVSATLFTVGASAQVLQYLDLSGRYRCVANCTSGQPGQLAYITQSGTEMNMVNDAGMPSRAWMERPGRIWVERAGQGAIYSADGLTIQFDSGTVWQRDVMPEVAPAVAPIVTPPAPRDRRMTRAERRAAERAERNAARAPRAPQRPAVTDAYDGSWSVLLVTQAGPCDREYRFGAQIVDGNVVYDGGGAVNVQGQVFSDGRIWVNVSAGGQTGSGEGRLSNAVGSGNWRGQAPGGSCAGVWQATRRG